MSLYKIKKFQKFCEKQHVSDADLRQAVDEIEAGNADADLGGGVFKQRVARAGGGKSTGFRVLVAHKTEEHYFFVHGFGKNVKDNIKEDELDALKKYAKELGGLSQDKIAIAVDAGEFVEIEEVGDDEVDQ